MADSSFDIAIVGGGVAGLAAAYTLRTKYPSFRTVLFEGSGRFGGPIRTEHADGFLLEHGPDGFVRSKPAAESLIRAVGLGDQLIETQSSARGVHVYRNGRLCRVPEGVFLVAPTRIRPWLLSPLASVRGRLRALAEVIVPRGEDQDNESIESFVRRRFGDEVSDLLASSILAGIHSGDPKRLSISATFPQLVKLERESRSLILALRKLAFERHRLAARSGPTSAFYSLRDGLQSLIDTLVETVGPDVCHLESPVRAIVPVRNGWEVTVGSLAPVVARSLLVAVPPSAAAELFLPLSRSLANTLRATETESSVIALLGYRQSQLRKPLNSSGFVVAGGEDLPITACTILSQKWAGRAPRDHVILRAFMGGFRQPQALSWSDNEVLDRARRGFAATLQVEGEPVLARVVRYREHSPQLSIGHQQRQNFVHQHLREFPPVVLAGAGYDGVGIPDSIRQGVEGSNILHRILAKE